MSNLSFNKTAVLKLTVNGRAVSTEVGYDESLLSLLRNRLLLTGTKAACFQGECGACSVIVDGALVNSCLMPALQAEGATIRTIEGVAAGGRVRLVVAHRPEAAQREPDEHGDAERDAVEARFVGGGSPAFRRDTRSQRSHHDTLCRTGFAAPIPSGTYG